MGIKLSVVFGTMNRRPYLERCVASIRQNVGNLEYEIVVVVGPCSDGSLTCLRAESAKGDLVILEQQERTGAVKAFNLGFAKTQGEYVAVLNDDCEVAENCLERACAILDSHEDVGQVAIPFSLPDEPPHVDHVNLWGLRLVYANFGVIRRKLGNSLGWWGNHYQYAGDTELSIKVWNANLKVVPLVGGHIVHHQLKDDTRVPNVESRSLSVWNNAPVPALVRAMRKGQPRVPTSKNRRVPAPTREPYHPTVKPKRRPTLPGVEGMSLVRYLGNGLVVKTTPTGQDYHFSGGACLYVDDRDLQFVFDQARPGESLRVL